MHSLVIFNGSARKGQYTEHVTAFVKKIATATGNWHCTVIDPREYNFVLDDEGPTAGRAEITAAMADADAFVVVAPEYNHSYSGSLKYLLDLNMKEYIHKPVACIGVSSGPFGGTRVIESLMPVLREVGMVTSFADVNVSKVGEEITDGQFQNPEKWEKRMQAMLQELYWLSQTLQYGRKNIASKHHE